MKYCRAHTTFVAFLVLVLLVGPAAAAGSTNQDPGYVTTFNIDIAPIIWSHCATCHRPGQNGPFSLMTYEDARPRAREILKVTRNRTMPPWKPEPGYGMFEGARRLSDQQLAAFERWAEAGYPRGNEDELPPLPLWTEGWQLGQPDLVLAMAEPYALKSDGQDIFRTFVIRIPGETLRYVKALEFNPGTQAVHHANIKIDSTRSSRRLDDGDPEPGFEGGASRQSRFPDGHFLGWTPGQSPRVSPGDMAWRLPPGSDLVVETHLMPTGKPEQVQIRVALYFGHEPPTRLPYTVRLARQDLDIAAGQRVVLTDSFTLPVDVDALGIQPHAHYLAAEVRAVATLPDGSTRPLIYIKQWDFRWQDSYRYSAPLTLPRGTVLTMQYTYDNSASNRRNPNRPPKRITFGQTTTSEMASLWIQVVPRNDRDRQILDGQFSAKLLRDDIAGYEKMLEVSPRDARLRAALAYGYLEGGRLADAIAQFQQAVQLDPTSARQYDLGSALLEARRMDEAVERFSEAVRLRPDFGEALYGLGVAQHQQGRLDEAIESYRRALGANLNYVNVYYNLGRALAARKEFEEAIRMYRDGLTRAPDDAEALSGLAAALALQDRTEEAVAHYRRALQVAPNLPGALVDLAWILATSDRADIRNPSEAVRLAERVAGLTKHQNASALDTLSVAYAAAGQLDRAIATAQTAIQIALVSGDSDLAARIRERLAFYLKHK